jgi:hypothetical protein
VYRRQRTQPHPFLNLFKRRGVLLLRDKARNEIVKLALTPSNRHAPSIGEGKANVNIRSQSSLTALSRHFGKWSGVALIGTYVLAIIAGGLIGSEFGFLLTRKLLPSRQLA